MKSKMIYHTFPSPLIEDYALPKMKKKVWKMYFFHQFFVFNKDNTVIFYDMKKKKIDYVFRKKCTTFSRINDDIILLMNQTNAYMFNYKTKRVEEKCSLWFPSILVQSVFIKNNYLIIFCKEYMYVIDNFKANKNMNSVTIIEYGNDDVNMCNVLEINDEIIAIFICSRPMYPYVLLFNINTKQIVTTIHETTFYINKLSGKIEKSLVKNKPIIRISKRKGADEKELILLSQECYDFLDKNKIKKYFSIVENKLIGYIEKVDDYCFSVKIMDVEKLEIIQQIDYAGDKFILFRLIRNKEFIIFKIEQSFFALKINFDNCKKYLSNKEI